MITIKNPGTANSYNTQCNCCFADLEYHTVDVIRNSESNDYYGQLGTREVWYIICPCCSNPVIVAA